MSGIRIGFLRGDLTDPDDFDRLLESMKHQIRTESITTFIHRADGAAILAQIIFIPNITKHRGLPLKYECLSQEFLGQMALDQQEDATGKNQGLGSSAMLRRKKNIRDWIQGMKELSYHFFRFGCLSEPFFPPKSNDVDVDIENHTQYAMEGDDP